MIYFDNGSTTKISEPVYEKLCDFLKNNFAKVAFEAETAGESYDCGFAAFAFVREFAD